MDVLRSGAFRLLRRSLSRKPIKHRSKEEATYAMLLSGSCGEELQDACLELLVAELCYEAALEWATQRLRATMPPSTQEGQDVGYLVDGTPMETAGNLSVQ
ncbi:rbcL [Symbiodinium sp. KB8]|nr:rbcL [Symbiodinium sp. KB8]